MIQEIDVPLPFDPEPIGSTLAQTITRVDPPPPPLSKVLSRVVFSSGKGDWGTPPDLFLTLHEEFNFTTDLAANASNTLLPQWIGPDHPNPERRDALTTDWSDLEEGGPQGGVRGWLNPPYGPRVGAWVEKALGEREKGVLTVMLLPARTDTKWFHDWAIHGEIRLLRGRLRFQGAAASAPFPSMLVVFRPVQRGWVRVAQVV